MRDTTHILYKSTWRKTYRISLFLQNLGHVTISLHSNPTTNAMSAGGRMDFLLKRTLFRRLGNMRRNCVYCLMTLLIIITCLLLSLLTISMNSFKSFVTLRARYVTSHNLIFLLLLTRKTSERDDNIRWPK